MTRRAPGRAQPTGAAATDLRIGPAFPNPSRGAATFAAHLDREGSLSISIVDSGGRRVRTDAPRRLGVGSHRLSWDGRDERGARVASGVYFVQLKIGAEVTTRKVTVLRD